MKVTKDDANYREADGSSNCGNCVYMNSDGTCDEVEGLVEPDMVCDLWSQAGGANRMTDNATEVQPTDDAELDAELEATHAALGATIAARAKRNKKPRHRSRPLLPEYRRATGGLEVRQWSVSGLEVRDSKDGKGLIEVVGEPIVYNRSYTVMDMFGEFEETMHAGVCSTVLAAGADTRFLFNHDGLPLARTISGTLTLDDSEDALGMRALLDPRQQLANDLAVAIERGDVSQMSCGFIVADDAWSDDWMKRDVYRFEDLLDVSAVTYPASPTTSVEVANRMLLEVPVESRARIRKLWSFATELREGKVLSAENADHIKNAAKSLLAVAEKAGLDLEDDAHPDVGGDDGTQSGPAGNSGSGPGSQDGSGSRDGDPDAETRTDEPPVEVDETPTATSVGRDDVRLERDLLRLRRRR